MSFEGATVSKQTYTMGRRISPLTLPEARLGTGELTYSLSCAADSTDPCDSTTGWPPGLKFDDTSRTLFGAPTEEGDFKVTYTVTDEANADKSFTFEIRVNGPLFFGGDAAAAGFDFTRGIPIDPDNTEALPEASGGSGVKTYSASGVPAGLAFNSEHRTLSGTPGKAGTFKLLLEATDEAGTNSSVEIPVRVHQPPSFKPTALNLGFPGSAQELPAANGGSGPLTYSLACASGSPTSCDDDGLPSGIDFDKETRTVSGSLDAAAGRYYLDLTATDRSGATASQHVDLLVAKIEIKAHANQADMGNVHPNNPPGAVPRPLPDLTIPVPEGENDLNNVPRYTLRLLAPPNQGEEVRIELSDPPSGDPHLQYFYSNNPKQPTRFIYGSNYNPESSLEIIPLFAAEDDDGDNGTATIRHTVASNDPAYDNLTSFDVTLVEIDNDPRVELSLAPATLAEGAEETTVTVTATVKPPAGNTSMDSFSDDTVIDLELGGTAKAGTDYTVKALPSSITILATQTTATADFTLTPVQDELYEGNETVEVSGTAAAGRTPSPATLTIMDNDPPPLSADCGNGAVREGGDGLTRYVLCTVTRHDGRGNPVAEDNEVTVTYTSYTPDPEGDPEDDPVDDTAATPGVDYEKVDGKAFKIDFAASPPFSTVTVKIYDDDSGQRQRAPSGGQDPTDEEGPADPDAYRGTVAFGETAYSVTEGGAATTIAVTLDPAPPEDIAIPVPIAGKGGPGVTAEDWRFAVGEGTNDTWNAATRTATVQFAAGETERTIALEALDDEEIEGDETLTLRFHANRLPAGVTVDPEAAEAVVTLVDDDLADLRGRALEHVLAAFGRTVATDAVTLLTGRMADDAPDTGARLTLGGRTFTLRSLSGSTEPDGARDDTAAMAFNAVNAFDPLNPPDPRGPPVTAGQSISLRQLLNGASFRYRHGDPEDGLLTLWGQGGTARFEGGDGTDFSLDGEATSGWLGLDWRQHGTVAGLSLAQYRGDVGYDFAGNQDAGGEVDLELTSLFPYARLSLDNGLDLWGIAGLGKGNLTLTDGFGGNSTDLSMQMAAAGLRRALTPLGSGVTLAAKADGFLVRMASEARGRDTIAFADDLPSVDAAAQRLRLALEAGYTHTLTSGAVLRPTAELGARYDGGDAETGAGLDLAGGVRYQSPSRRLLVEGRGRVLLVHAATGFREWAASGLVRLTPETGGQGLSFSLQPAWGVTQTGPAALWNAALPTAANTPRGRVTAELGYGLPAFGGRGLLTPYAGTDLAQGTGRTYRVGIRSLLGANATLSLEGARRETGQGQPDTRIGLQASFVF